MTGTMLVGHDWKRVDHPPAKEIPAGRVSPVLDPGPQGI